MRADVDRADHLGGCFVTRERQRLACSLSSPMAGQQWDPVRPDGKKTNSNPNPKPLKLSVRPYIRHLLTISFYPHKQRSLA